MISSGPTPLSGLHLWPIDLHYSALNRSLPSYSFLQLTVQFALHSFPHCPCFTPKSSQLKKKNRTTKPWSSNTIWHTKTLELLWHFLFDSLCFTFSKINSFNSGVSRLGGSIHPHGNPRYSWKKIRILFSLFEACYKTSFSGSMFVCLPWAITNWIWEMFSFKNTGNPIAFTETKAWPWHW